VWIFAVYWPRWNLTAHCENPRPLPNTRHKKQKGGYLGQYEPWTLSRLATSKIREPSAGQLWMQQYMSVMRPQPFPMESHHLVVTPLIQTLLVHSMHIQCNCDVAVSLKGCNRSGLMLWLFVEITATGLNYQIVLLKFHAECSKSESG
jgi:hypothetical protein